MGVYIPNIEKPKDCEVCPFFVLDGAITDDNEWVSYSVCDLLSKTIGDADKMNDCPLIEIVPCKECKYWHDDGIMTTCDKHIGHGFEDDYFCADGERRTDPNNCKGCEFANTCDIKALRERQTHKGITE